VNGVHAKTQCFQCHRAQENKRVGLATEHHGGCFYPVNCDVSLSYRNHILGAISIMHRPCPRCDKTNLSNQVGRSLGKQSPCIDQPLKFELLIRTNRVFEHELD